MRSAVAFVETSPGTLAVAEGDLRRLASPPDGVGAFYAPDFRLADPAPWRVPTSEARATLPLRAFLEEFSRRGPAGSLPEWTAPDEPRFVRAYRSLAASFARGDLLKGVPVTRACAAWPDDEAEPLFRRLLSRIGSLPEGLHPYGLLGPARDGAGSEFIVGATPEILFDRRGRGTIRSEAIAGTRVVGSAAPPLLSDPRIREEHGRVVHDLVERMSLWGHPEATAPRPCAFGTLEHLVSVVGIETAGGPAFDEIARHLHPTAALGSYPRGAAGSRWLEEIDPLGERGSFGAPFGFRYPDGTGRCLVAIRGIRYLGGRLEIWAGCGVVPSSRYDDEWREACDKIRAVRSLWGI